MQLQLRLEPTEVRHLSGAPIKGRLLALPANIRLEKLAMDKRSSLLQKFVTYNRKIFYDIDT